MLTYFSIKSNFDRYVTLTLTFSQSFFEQNVSVQLKLIAIFVIRDVLAKMREISQNAGFPARLRNG